MNEYEKLMQAIATARANDDYEAYAQAGQAMLAYWQREVDSGVEEKETRQLEKCKGGYDYDPRLN